MPQAKRCMQKVGGQGAAWHWGKERGSGGTPAAIFDKFVRSKDVAGRGQQGGQRGGQWGQVECTAADKYFIHFHNFNKIEEIYSRRRRRQATKQQQQKPVKRKQERRRRSRSRQDKSKKERKDGKSVNGKRKNVRNVMKAPPKARLQGTVEQQR